MKTVLDAAGEILQDETERLAELKRTRNERGGSATNVNEPRVDGSEAELILVVGLCDLGMSVYHPAKLDGREVG